MNIRQLKTEKFSEELYFLLMSSNLRTRIQSLGAKHGLSRKEIKDHVHSLANSMVNSFDYPTPNHLFRPLTQAV